MICLGVGYESQWSKSMVVISNVEKGLAINWEAKVKVQLDLI